MNTQRRLFFALWPDDPVRQQIKLAPYPHLKPKTTPIENWHLTLVFLGPTNTNQQLKFEQAADTVNADSFTLKLDITGQFERARVSWIGCRHLNRPLLELQKNLESGLREHCPKHPAFSSGPRPYHPHVTLYRHIRKACIPEKFTAVQWQVDSFCLIESRPSDCPVYRILKRWYLR